MEKNIDDATYRASLVGTYGHFISDYINKQTESFAFYDIGANQGIYTLLAAKNLACKSVVAFEPIPLTYSFLVRNIHRNGCQEIVFPICAAIAEPPQHILEFHVPRAHSGAASLFLEDETDEKVKAIVIGGGALQSLFASDVISIAKIDVEGAECIVLEELRNNGILAQLNAIIIEMNGNIQGKGHIDAIKAFFGEAGWVETRRQQGFDTHYDALYERR